MLGTAEKTCSRCSGSFPLSFFRRANTAYAHAAQHMAVCKGCEQLQRDEQKAVKRWPTKVRDCTKGHARKLGIPLTTLVSDYGWQPERMAHEAEHTYSNGCPNCGHSFAGMGHGLADITLDIVHPEAPPTYGANTRWICMTCNRAKGRTPPGIYAEVQMCWNRWRIQQQKLAEEPKNFGTLWEGLDWEI